MCFRPPTIDFAEIECPECGAMIPMDSEECPECGVAIALNASAPPAIQMPPAVMPGSPGARPKPPGAPKAAGRPPMPPGAPKAPARPEAARSSERETVAAPDEIRVPVVGGRIRMPLGMELLGDASAPEVPTGPGFEEAPDISNTGNYFTSGVYNNG
ncbi:MAG: hypothetical protein ACOYIP_08205 [Coriobacteriales bacterium]|jgi:hypothetical protein